MPMHIRQGYCKLKTLEHTDKSILDVAVDHGYDNGSKFAAAFRAVKGVDPTRYRQICGKK